VPMARSWPGDAMLKLDPWPFASPSRDLKRSPSRMRRWHGSSPPRRPACRMVPPAPDAWASGAIAPPFEPSLCRGLRCRETGFPGRRNPNHGSAVSETKRSYKKPANSGPFSTTNRHPVHYEATHGLAARWPHLIFGTHHQFNTSPWRIHTKIRPVRCFLLPGASAHAA